MSSKHTASQAHTLIQDKTTTTKCNNSITTHPHTITARTYNKHTIGQTLAPSSANNVTNLSLRIALLGYRSHPFVGGQGIYLKYLSRALVALGHQVDVISGPPYPQLDDNVNLIKIPSLNLYEHKNHATALRLKHCLSWSDFYEWWTMLTGGFGEPYTFGRRASAYLKTRIHNYDIIHDNQCLAYGLLDIQKMGLPLVTTIHHPITKDRDSALAQAPNRTHRWLVKRWYSFLTMQQKVAQELEHVITVSQASKNDIEKSFGRPQEKIQLIPNGVDTSQFYVKDRSHVDKWQLITTASSDQPIKGLSYLIDALAQLKQQYPLIKLTVIGQLNPNGHCAKLINTHKLNKHITFVSGISTQELIQQYARAAIAVCPSIYEGFGLPVIEAMSCSVPVITTYGGALPEVIGDSGLIVKPANSHELVQAIKSLLDDPELANHIGKRGRERAEKNFCWNKVAKDLSAFYQTCIEQKKHANR